MRPPRLWDSTAGRGDQNLFSLLSQVSCLKSQASFTFIELVFVTVVLGVLAVLAIPRMQQTWAHLQAERTAFEQAQLLRTARTIAIAQSEVVEWVWDGQAHRVWLGRQQADGSVAPLAGRFGHPRSLPEDVELTIVQPAESSDRVSFFPDGTSQSVTLVIGGKSLPRYQIVVDETTGQVAVQAASLPAPH